ncbi:deoxyuridine 5'-triphosphate nucleotidohydrolase [Paenibacillus glycanilyticus]|uniref:dUTP diphosphatase n=1 Tax=Paenibacillus glycanilyticus TaxID=126569 RepID=A0ABQ6NRA9_9BACL|nr:dUTP diphosphatase [Paenibacillus glycanilyticus]GMK47623.1 deoxyuridine 5'-triphosphate nucleotidohydrolase [Paenibacillus glycanilyticus]
MDVNIRKVRSTATVPTYATVGAAGFDLYAAENVTVSPGQTVLVPLGLQFEIPEGYEMQIRPRSGVTLNTKLRVANSPGTVDSDYTGEVSVILQNVGAAEGIGLPALLIDGTDYAGMPNTIYPLYYIRTGDRIAQGVIAPVSRVSFVETDEELTQTERGENGFGSTGITAEVTA